MFLQWRWLPTFTLCLFHLHRLMSNFTKQTAHQTSSVLKSYSSMSFILIHLQMNASLATRYSKQASCLGATHTPGVFQYHDLWLFCVFQGTGTTNPCILFICTNAINFKALDEIHIHGLFSKRITLGCILCGLVVLGNRQILWRFSCIHFIRISL